MCCADRFRSLVLVVMQYLETIASAPAVDDLTSESILHPVSSFAKIIQANRHFLIKSI